jgi:serine protease Do
MQQIKFLSLIGFFVLYALSISSYGGNLENLPNLVEKLSPSVVRIETTSIREHDTSITGDPFFDEFFKRQFGDNLKPRYGKGLGSGFIYSGDGFIVTNLHVVEKANDISIVLIDGTKHKAKIIGTDKRTDLALLKIDIRNPINKVKIGNSDLLRIGEWVIAIGNPLGLGTTVTTGIISAKGRYIDGLDSTYVDFIQTDAALNRGNSGGPLFNLSGEVVGVNTAIAARGQGIGFAIPINMAIGVIEELKIHGKVDRGWLGVVIQAINPEIADSLKLDSTRGALVAEVVVDGPAFKAGLKRGDIILSINDKQIKNAEELPREVGKLKPQEPAKLKVLRGRKQITINVRLGELLI